MKYRRSSRHSLMRISYIGLTVCELPRVVLHVAVVVLRVLVADLVAELVVRRVLQEADGSEGGSGKEEESD